MKCVSHLQNGKSSVVLVANQLEVVVHSIDGGIGYVDPVQESKDEQQAEEGNDSEINLPDQRRLVDVREYLPGSDFLITSELGELSLSGESQETQSWWYVNVSRR